jgi:hypothetical protein
VNVETEDMQKRPLHDRRFIAQAKGADGICRTPTAVLFLFYHTKVLLLATGCIRVTSE